MKMPILVLLLIILTLSVNAQSKSPMIYGNALVKDKRMQRIGSVLSVIGGVALVTGNIKYWKIYNDYGNTEPPTDKVKTYSRVMLGGLGLIAVGIPVWAIGKVNERHFEVALVKFKGSTSINGIGLKIRF
jgi:hypothetical protein